MNKLYLAPLLFLSIATHAAEPEQAPAGEAKEKKLFAILAGPAFVTKGVGDDSYFTFGGRLAFPLGNRDSGGVGSLGLAVATLSEDTTVAGIAAESTMIFIGAEYVARKVGGSGFYLGGRAGLGMISQSATDGVNTIDGSATVFTFAPVLGLEVPLGGSANLVFDAAWVNFGGGTMELTDATGATGSVEFDNTAAVTLHLGLGFSF
jgi:hypothetical protein